MSKVKAWSVSAQQILDKKLLPNMPEHMREVVIKEAQHRAFVDVFGEGYKLDRDGKPQEQGIGSQAWYEQASAEECERALAAIERFEGKASADAVRQRISHLRGKK